MKRNSTSPFLASTFAAPAVIGVASLIGLVAALLGDGPSDWVSWAGLFIPLAAIAWAWRRRA